MAFFPDDLEFRVPLKLGTVEVGSGFFCPRHPKSSSHTWWGSVWKEPLKAFCLRRCERGFIHTDPHGIGVWMSRDVLPYYNAWLDMNTCVYIYFFYISFITDISTAVKNQSLLISNRIYFSLEGTIHISSIPPRESWKIIDSKVPAGMGIC